MQRMAWRERKRRDGERELEEEMIT